MDLGKIWNGSVLNLFSHMKSSVKVMCTKEQKNLLNLTQKKAINTGEPVEGVKGPSWLAGLHNYNKVNGTGIEYMHCVLLIKSNPISIKIFQKLTNCSKIFIHSILYVEHLGQLKIT